MQGLGMMQPVNISGLFVRTFLPPGSLLSLATQALNTGCGISRGSGIYLHTTGTQKYIVHLDVITCKQNLSHTEDKEKTAWVL